MHHSTGPRWISLVTALSLVALRARAQDVTRPLHPSPPSSPTPVAPAPPPPETSTVAPVAPLPSDVSAAPPSAPATPAATPSSPASAPIASTPSSVPLPAAIPSPAPAAPVPVPPAAPARTITLAEALSAARRNPPAVQRALAQARSAEAQVGLARAPLLPSVTGTTSVNGFLSNGSFVSGGVSTPVNVFSVSAWVEAAVGIRWTIWDFGRTSRNVEAAEHNARGARDQARAAIRTAMAQAASAYFVLLADEELVASLRVTVAQRERQLEIARGLVQAGARPPIEATRAEVALDSAQLDLRVAEAALVNDGAALASALGLDPAMSVRATRPRIEISVDDDPAHAADAAVASRPELAAARARVEQAEAQLASARAGYLPTLGAQASGSVRYTARSNSDPSPSELASASITFSVPIFDPTLAANVHAAEANLALARASLEEQSLALRTEAVQAAIAVRSARQTLAQAERVAAGAEANLRQAEGRYAAGAASLLELVDAQAADQTARVNVVRARLQFELAKVRLLAAMGRLDVLESQG